MRNFLTIASTIALISTPCFSKEKLKLSESNLIQLAKDSSPSLDWIKLNELNSKLQLNTFDENFETKLKVDSNYSKTEEKQFSQFSPVTSPISHVQFGAARNFKQGFALSVNAYSDQFTNSFVNKGTTTGISTVLTADLYKDILGKTTLKKYRSLEEEQKRSLIEGQIQSKAFLQNIRKLYWALVANNESIELTTKLLKSSEKQVAQAKKRLRNNIADSGEVAKYQSQAAARKASIIYLKYQRENLLQNLNQLVPDLNNYDLVLAPYNIEKTVQTVLACTTTISRSHQAPMDNTLYDELIKTLDQQYELDHDIANNYSGLDIKLHSEYKLQGKALGTSESITDFEDDKRKAYAVGVSISLPIESKQKTTEEILKRVQKKKYLASKKDNLSKIDSFHSQIVKSIQYLQQIMLAQKENSSFLQESLNVSSKKFKQARITVQQLVAEQDSLHQSSLDEIQTKLNIINTVLDYLAVYTETPCQLNRI